MFLCVAFLLPHQLLAADQAPPLTKPVLGVDIPGLDFGKNFADVAQKVDGGVLIPFLAQYISAAYRYLIGVSVIAAIIMVMYGGFRYMVGSAMGDVKRGKKIILDAILGLVLVLSAYLILQTVNPRLTELKGVFVPSGLPTGEAKTDAKAEDASPSAPPPGSPEGRDCSDPKFKITDLSKADFTTNKRFYNEIAGLLDANHIEAYKKAANDAGIPWEVLATVHYKEASMLLSGSGLNGDRYCNTKDNHNLLTECPRCADATRDNDFYCTAMILKNSSSGLSKDNLDSIKLAFCKHNGCSKAQIACQEKHTYVANKFDAEHTGYEKSGVDGLTTTCTPGCVRDFTVKGGSAQKCCTLKKFKKNLTKNNVMSCCKDDPNDSSITICNYNAGMRDKSNPCGNTTTDERQGTLLIYAIIKDLEKKGSISE